MPKTPTSAGGPRRIDAIEMAPLGSTGAASSSRKLEKSISMPVQRPVKTPTQSRPSAFDSMAQPRTPLQRGNTIRDAVVEFVGCEDDAPERPEKKQWNDRRLQYYNRKFKLSKDFVQSCDDTPQYAPLQQQPQAHSLSPVPQTPGLHSFHIVTDPLHVAGQEGRTRSTSIESRKPRRDSVFKIVTENCASLITKGRLTPTASSSHRMRRNNATASFTTSESPLQSLSLTPGYPGPGPVMTSLSSIRDPSLSEGGRSRGGGAKPTVVVVEGAELGEESARPSTRKRELHRVLEEHEYPDEYQREARSPVRLEEEGFREGPDSKGGVMRFPPIEPAGMAQDMDIRPAIAAATASAAEQDSKIAASEGKDVSFVIVEEGQEEEGAAAAAAASAAAAEAEQEKDDQPSTSMYPRELHQYISPEVLLRDIPGARLLSYHEGPTAAPAAAAASTSAAAAAPLPPLSTSPPFQLSRPTILPMDDELGSSQSMVYAELFFDITPTKRPMKSHPAMPELGSASIFPPHRIAPIPLGAPPRGTRRNLPPDRPPVPAGPKKVKFMEIHGQLIDKLKRQAEDRSGEQIQYRRRGVGAFGECLGRETKQLEELPEGLSRKLKSTVVMRPFFTYWVTCTQLMITLAALVIFGFGAFSPSFAKREGEVQSLDQTLITVAVYEKGNIWLGPKFADLIRLGAKYSPCMRPEQKIMRRIEQDRIAESYTGCCVHTDGSYCYQAGDQCPRTLATLLQYRHPARKTAGGSSKAAAAAQLGLRRSQSAPDLQQLQPGQLQQRPVGPAAPLSTQRRSEIVCGLDPDYCAAPSFYSFSREDITKWPLCNRDKPDAGSRPRHMTCKVIGRPCCIHLQGRCRITTKEYCLFVGGIFHDEASLCSQVNCLHGICGMIPFGDSPNQFYRLFTSLFLHAGILHMAVTVFFQLVFMRDLESYIGWKRMAFIYFISGVGGNLASAIFVPFNPEVGPSGALAGMVATLFVDVVANREILERPSVALVQNGGWLLALFGVGLLPWVDNWALLFGAVFGLLAAIVFFPDVGLSHGERSRRMLVGGGAIAMVALAGLLVYIFVENKDIECTWCGYFNCFNWYKYFALDPDDGNHFCDNQGLTLNTWLPI